MRQRRKRSLYAPEPIRVATGRSGRPGALPERVGGARVESVREEWLVEDRWWTSEPLRRRYLELVLDTGRCIVVFCDLATGRWYEQR